MAMESDTVTLPAAWAPALVSGDYSELSESESFRCREARHALECDAWDVVSCGEPYYTRHLRLYDQESQYDEGSVCDYAVIRP